ncbi:hypothetical protein M569_07210 [Genlisea aurea]|uniref:Calmodulin-binding protein n=1 Tax=Genlisea aurea TaxID=192259 RepID=S8E5D0_9LAMI|nr:hypothetical protein M569_07210 [Genlisea aurea]
MEETGAANFADVTEYSGGIESCSAPSSPFRLAPPFTGSYYSAPSSPTHFVLTAANLVASYTNSAAGDRDSSSDFDFSATYLASGASSPEKMTSADELFLNGQIRPMKLSKLLQRSQTLEPLIESEEEEKPSSNRGKEPRSLRRRTRSMSPLRNTDTTRRNADVESEKLHKISPNQIGGGDESNGKHPSASRSSSSGGRNSGRWEFLKDLLYRSKSEGRNRSDGHKSFSSAAKDVVKKTSSSNKSGKRRVPPPSPHEVHYTAKRAQAEEMRKRTFLPYRQGLLGFNSIAGIARALRAKS